MQEYINSESLFSTLYIEKKHIKEYRCKFKTDKITYSKSVFVEQRITLPKISLQWILHWLWNLDKIVLSEVAYIVSNQK